MQTILTKELLLTPEDTAKNYEFHFELPVAGAEAKALWLGLRYTPKTLEDKDKANRLLQKGFAVYNVPDDGDARNPAQYLPLTNLVTLCLLSPNGYVGAAHRPAAEQHHRIAPDKASPGFCPCSLDPGNWTLIVNVHCVLTEQCRCNIQVEVEEEE